MAQRPESQSLIEYLICKKTIAVILALLTALVVSFICLSKIAVEVMPREAQSPFLYIQVSPSRSMSVSELERLVSMPVEGALRTVPAIQSIDTSTSQFGTSVFVSFKAKTDLNLSVLNIQEALQELESFGILEMKDVTISRFNPSAKPLFTLAARIPLEITDPYQDVQRLLKQAFNATAGIARVDIQGVEPFEYQFSFTPQKLFQHGLDANAFGRSLIFDNVRQSIAQIPVNSQVRLSSLRTTFVNDEFSTVRNLVVKPGTSLTLQNLSQERLIDKTAFNISRKDGHQAVFLDLFQDPKTNVFNVEQAVQKTMTKVTDSNLGFGLSFVTNKANELRLGLSDVLENLWQSLAITVFCVLFLLRRVLPTVIVSLVIPMSLVFVVALLYVSGRTLNLVTLSGLTLAIGLIVDNGIVVLERIEQLLMQGVDKFVAAGRAAYEMFLPLLMSTLTNIIIFLPAAFVQGDDSFISLLKAFQLPVGFALIVSLLVAVFFVPVASLIGKQRIHKPIKDEVNQKSVVFFRFVHRWRTPVTAAILLLVWIVWKKSSSISETDISASSDPFTELRVIFNNEVSTSERRVIFSKVEKDVLSQSVSFDAALLSRFSPDSLQGSLIFLPDSPENIDASIEIIEGNLEKYIAENALLPGVRFEVGDDYHFGQSQRKRLRFEFSGTQTYALESQLEKLREQLLNIEAVEKVNTEAMERGRTEFEFLPKIDVINQYGLALDSISKQVNSILRHYQFEDFKDAGRVTDVKIQVSPAGGEWNLRELGQMRIALGNNQFVPLSDLGTFQKKKVTASSNRENGFSSSKLYIYFKEQADSSVVLKAGTAVKAAVNGFPFDSGYGLKKDDSAERIAAMGNRSNFVVLLSIFLIYLVLASLFESVIIPIAILVTVPLAIVFGMGGLYAMNMDLDPMARLGLLMLTGTAVSNAILLVDVIGRLRASGRKRDEAVVLGCAQRVRAVLTTSAASIVGLLPVAMGQSKILGIPYSSLGVCVIAGSFFSTLLTLVLLPSAYVFFDSLESQCRRMTHYFFQRS